MMKKFLAAFVAAFFATAAFAQNSGTVTNHAYAIGKGPGVQGYSSMLCTSAQLAVGQAAADPICRTVTGDWTISAAGVATLATVNGNVGTFGSATQCITTTQNAKGLTTAISAANCTPAVGSITGLGTGVATALGVNVGTPGAFVVNGGALGTPSSGVGTNLTGTAAGLTAGNATLAATVTTNANLTGPVTSVGNATTIGANQVTRANEVQGIARSVIGVTGNATANVADIQGTANQFLGVNNAGTALAFGTMSGDCTLATAVITCTQSAGNFNVVGILQTGGDSRASAQFDVTSSAALANVPGLTVNVSAGQTYGFKAGLFYTANAASGVRMSMGGTATATAIVFEGMITTSSGFSVLTKGTALGSVIGSTTSTGDYMWMEGTITVNAGGTLTAQFAQNVSGGVASSVLVGSSMKVWKIQ